MAVKKEKGPIVKNVKLLLALKGFMPEFGNDEDLAILKASEKLHKKLASIDSKKFRDLEAQNNYEVLTSKMREIQNDERNLISRIQRRNLDF